MGALLNGHKISNFTPVEIKENDLLEFGNAHCGKRTYMAVAGGIKTPEILNSRSQYKGITSESKLSKSKMIPFDMVKFKPPKGIRINPRKTKSEEMYNLILPSGNLTNKNGGYFNIKSEKGTFDQSNEKAHLFHFLY